MSLLLACGRRRPSPAPWWSSFVAVGAGLWLAATSTAGADDPPPAPAQVRLMTFNIRYLNRGDGLDAWPLRRDELARFVAGEQPDIVGFQEVVHSQLEDLASRLEGYGHFGVGRDDGRQAGEYSPLFYRSARWKVVEQSTFWLSETPAQAGSRGWDAALPRVCTWGVLEEIASGQRLVVFNTHFDHQGAEARRHSGVLLRERARRQAESPVVVMGDLNATLASPPLAALTAADDGPAAWRLLDARDVTKQPPAGPDSTWNGFREITPGRRIDHVLVSPGLSVAAYRIVDARRANGRFLSDHLPVLVDLAWPPAP